MKTKFDCSIRNIFEKDILTLNLDNNFYEELQQLKEEPKLRSEIANLYYIYKDKDANEINKNIIDLKTNETIKKMNLYNEYNSKSKLIEGISLLLNNLNINKGENEEFYSQLKELNDSIKELNDLIKEKKIEKFIEDTKNFFNNNKVIDEKKPIVEFIKSLSKFPRALEWLKNMDEKKIQSINRYIIDSDYNEDIILTNIKDIKNFFFEELNNKTAHEIIDIIFNLNKNNPNLAENIEYFGKTFPDLERINI